MLLTDIKFLLGKRNPSGMKCDLAYKSGTRFSPSRLLLFASLLALALPSAIAGGNGGCVSHVTGIFFASALGGEVFFPDTKAMVQLKAHCDRHGLLWAHGEAKPFKCEKMGDWSDGNGTYLKTDADDSRNPLEILLLSTTILPKSSWVTRSPLKAEIEDVRHVLEAKRQRYSRALKMLTSRAATVVELVEGNSAIILIPGEIKRDEFSTSVRHVVAIKDHGRTFLSGEIDDTPNAYVDIDGDGFPEIITAPNCDGICRTLWSVRTKVKGLVRYSEH